MTAATEALVPVAAPARAVERQRAEVSAAFEAFLSSGRYILGFEHARFEREFADFLGARHCVGVASGTDGLELAVAALAFEPGDTVVAAANCGGYAATAARQHGLVVQYADVDPESLSLTRSNVEGSLSGEVRAVVVTHLYGLIADVEAIAELCRERGIALIEDCAQAAGARRDGRAAGTFGDAAVFSFYPTKNLAALGDAGAVVTSRDDVADRLRLLRQYGWDRKYEISMRGCRNSRLDELQAAILRVRLPHLDVGNARRRAIVARYAEALSPRVGRFVMSGGDDYVAHLAVALVDDRERVRAELESAGIGTDVHYPIPDHQQPAWRDEYDGVRLPVTEHAAEHVVTVPCFPELTDEEIDRVCEALSEL